MDVHLDKRHDATTLLLKLMRPLQSEVREPDPRLPAGHVARLRERHARGRRARGPAAADAALGAHARAAARVLCGARLARRQRAAVLLDGRSAARSAQADDRGAARALPRDPRDRSAVRQRVRAHGRAARADRVVRAGERGGRDLPVAVARDRRAADVVVGRAPRARGGSGGTADVASESELVGSPWSAGR